MQRQVSRTGTRLHMCVTAPSNRLRREDIPHSRFKVVWKYWSTALGVRINRKVLYSLVVYQKSEKENHGVTVNHHYRHIPDSRII